MFDKADVVIIATFVSSKDTSEHTMLRDLTPPSKVIGVVSDFEIRLTLKGPRDLKGFQLHHYRLDDVEYANGPSLIAIKPGRKPTFLLFLIKEKDGRYAPVTDKPILRRSRYSSSKARYISNVVSLLRIHREVFVLQMFGDALGVFGFDLFFRFA